jgi:hypothetical protein
MENHDGFSQRTADGLALMTTDAQAQESSALRMVQTIPLPNVEGRIDHMAVDPNGQRLFIAALETIRTKTASPQ